MCLKAFKNAYRFCNPYRVCKQFFKSRGEQEVHVYGETPFRVFAKIAVECGLNQNDVLFELGCGRGLGTFFLSHLTGCRSVGIDWVPKFIHIAQKIAVSIPDLQVSFYCSRMEDFDFSNASVIYLYGTCLPDGVIETLTAKFPSNARVITVSYQLSDYNSRFRTVKQFSACFPWGETDIYINRSGTTQ